MVKSDMLIARRVHELLEEADVLMGLESTVREARPPYLRPVLIENYIKANGHRLKLFRLERMEALGRAFSQRSKNVAGIPAGESFDFTLGVRRPPHSAVLKRPYTIELQIPSTAYERFCDTIGLGEYRSSEGLCPAPDTLRSGARPLIGGSVTIVRYDYTTVSMHIMERMAQNDCVMYPGEIGIMQHGAPASILTMNTPDPVTQRHEEIHSAQNLMCGVEAYTTSQGSLKTSLMHEESATIISRSERSMEPHGEPFLHTSFYAGTGTKYGDFRTLVEKIYPNRGRAKQITEQRRANSYATSRFYQDADPRLKKLAGWMFHFIGFGEVPEVLAMAKKVYETS